MNDQGSPIVTLVAVGSGSQWRLSDQAGRALRAAKAVANELGSQLAETTEIGEAAKEASFAVGRLLNLMATQAPVPMSRTPSVVPVRSFRGNLNACDHALPRGDRLESGEFES